VSVRATWLVGHVVRDGCKRQVHRWLEVSARRGAARGARGSTAAAAFETRALATSPARWRD
jgi:hypothetical protein